MVKRVVSPQVIAGRCKIEIDMEIQAGYETVGGRSDPADRLLKECRIFIGLEMEINPGFTPVRNDKTRSGRTHLPDGIDDLRLFPVEHEVLPQVQQHTQHRLNGIVPQFGEGRVTAATGGDESCLQVAVMG